MAAMADSSEGWSAESEQQFWDSLAEILSSPYQTAEQLDNALRSWLQLVAQARNKYLESEDNIARCSQGLLGSPIFRDNADYVRTQLIYTLLQEDKLARLHVIANFLLLDGRAEEGTFRRMISEGCFVRLLELIRSCGEQDVRLHRLLLQLMYEMVRIEHLRTEDLLQVDDDFVTYLFQIIESLSDDASDPYHYAVIWVLLVLNEQYMIADATAAVDASSAPALMTNRVIKVLITAGSSYPTFGGNIILLLNREREKSQQLLILKLLYLLFTTPKTREYFYTNDLKVLLDVIIRKLLDLSPEETTLRHTYLRVLHPLLRYTQLNSHPYYKRDQIISLLNILRGSDNSAHFAPPEPTTLRLVERVASVPWLIDKVEPPPAPTSPTAASPTDSLDQHSQAGSTVSVVASATEKLGVQAATIHQTQPDFRPRSQEKEPRPEGSPPRVPPPRRVLRTQKSLPEVPRHRHGVPVVKTPPPPPPPPPHTLRLASPQQGQGQETQTSVNGTGAADAGAPTGAPVPVKKQPPKIPPPRRKARLVAAAAAAVAGTATGGEGEPAEKGLHVAVEAVPAAPGAPVA